MATRPARRFTLELETGEPIRGRLLDDQGAALAFHGWLELSSALQRAWQPDADESAGRARANGEREDS